MATTELNRDGSKKVKQVCQEIMTREDEALAYRLQDEEFQSHYIRNRQERGTARVDVKAAKNAYLEEVRQAGLLREAELQRLSEDDAWLANELQQRLNEEEDLEKQQKTASEMQDEEYAQFLQEREKERVKKERHRRLKNRIERERKELERIEREREGSGEISEERVKHHHANSERLREGSSREERANGWSVELGTKNELHVNSKSEDPQSRIVATEERLRQQENEDEELARRLQRREDEKLRKLIEERDRRLAMKMQRQETEEYRRERAERQSRKAHAVHEDEIESTEPGGRKPSRSSSQKSAGRTCPEHQDCDPSMHLYEEPVLHGLGDVKCASKTDDQRAEEEAVAEMRPKSHSITSRSRPDLPIYETLNFPSLSEEEEASKRRLTEKVEREGVQGREGPLHNTPQRKSSEGSPQGANRHRFVNVAASIDPTFKGEFEEKPADEDKVWAIGDSGIMVSSASKPAPLIQNTKRKQAKSAKDKEKCKQQ